MASIVKVIEVEAPVGQVFAYWKNFENFPHFMENVERIDIIGPEQTHWVAKGPFGLVAEWDAVTTTLEEDKKIAWRTQGGNIETHGAVLFQEVGTDATRVTVGIEFHTPGGAIGEAALRLIDDPEIRLAEDLQRFKEVVEARRLEFAVCATSAEGVPGGSDHTAGIN